MDSTKIISVKEAARYGFSERYLRKLLANGIIPASQPNGGKYFMERNDFEKWLMSNKKSINNN